MKLIFASGEEQGREVELKPPFISIGRETDNDVVLANDAISRYHAKIEKDGNIWVIRDLESSNGVRVNGQKIDESSPIAHKDEIRISEFVFTVKDETVGEDQEHKSAFNIDPGLNGDSGKDGNGDGASKDTPAQKMVRLLVTAGCTMLLLLALYAFLFAGGPGKVGSTDMKGQRERRLQKYPLQVYFKEERFGKDPKTGHYNIFVYQASIEDKLLRVSVRNVADSIDKPQQQIDLKQREVSELKELLKDDHFVDVEAPPGREQNGRYERIQLMIMAGNRGNYVDYVNILNEMPAAVTHAIDKIKTLIEERLKIPKLTYDEAVKESDRLFRIADKKYRDRRVDPLNLYQAVNYSQDAINTIDGYSKAPPFLKVLKELNKTANNEFDLAIDTLKKDAVLAERSKRYEKALGYYQEIVARIGDSTNPEYVRAMEGIHDMKKHLKLGPRK